MSQAQINPFSHNFSISVAKVRISEQNTKKKSIFLLFSSESTSQTAGTVLFV
jgi:hypothetical protein